MDYRMGNDYVGFPDGTSCILGIPHCGKVRVYALGQAFQGNVCANLIGVCLCVHMCVCMCVCVCFAVISPE